MPGSKLDSAVEELSMSTIGSSTSRNFEDGLDH